MTSRIERCIVHIGSEKTGTTSIQHYFSKSRAELLNQGFLYPRSLAYGNERLHRKLSDLGCDRKDHVQSEMMKAFGQECSGAAASGVHTIVLSSEFLHSRLRHSSDVARIGEFLKPLFEEIRIVYYARRQDMLLASMHSTGVRGGFTTSDSALSVYEHKGHHYFDHLRVCDLWAEQFGVGNIICRVYERNRLVNADVVDDFSALVGLKRDAARAPPVANESLSFETISALLFLNRSDRRGDRDLRRKLVVKGKKRNGARIPMLTKAEARDFLGRFQESNNEFFARYVEKDLATDFSNDFTAFPDSLPSLTVEEIQSFILG